MFGRLLFWLRTRTDRRRGLFTFFDGRRYRRVDALDAARKFFSHPKVEWDDADSRIKNGPAMMQLDFVSGVASAVREILNVPAPEDGGLTEIGCVEVFLDFRYYLGDVKKNGNLFPTLSANPVSESQSLVRPEPLPSASSVSGSTQTGQSDAPGGLPAGATSSPTIAGQLTP